MRATVVTGGSSGLGDAIIRGNRDGMYINLSHAPPPTPTDNALWFECNVRNILSVRKARARVDEHGFEIDRLINNAGVNCLEKIENINSSTWYDVMDTNAKGILHTAQAFMLDLQRTKGTILNIVSNASHVPMTHSLVYNASKGAAHIMTLQMAREWTKSKGITVFGISPAKLAGTAMSSYIDELVPYMRNWTTEQAREYQLNALVTGREIPPERLAEFINWLLADKNRHFHLSGCVIPYGA